MTMLNLKFAALGAIAALAVTGGTLAATSAPLRAAELVVTARAPAARIGYDDLNLRAAAGKARLAARVRHAAETLCVGTGVETLKDRLADAKCRDGAIAAAAPQIAKAVEGAGRDYAFAGSAIVRGR
jgi:UrcA family protein